MSRRCESPLILGDLDPITPQPTHRRALLTHPQVRRAGYGLDNAMMESFWSSMKTKLRNCRKWKTASSTSATCECIEILYNRQRWHAALDYRTPIE